MANTDVTPFIRAHMEVQLHQVRALALRERVQQRISTAIGEAVTAVRLDPRMANAVWDAFFGRSVTPRDDRPLADVSPATATTDLAAAVAAGLLRPEGRARPRRYRAGERLYPQIGAALRVTPALSLPVLRRIRLTGRPREVDGPEDAGDPGSHLDKARSLRSVGGPRDCPSESDEVSAKDTTIRRADRRPRVR